MPSMCLPRHPFANRPCLRQLLRTQPAIHLHASAHQVVVSVRIQASLSDPKVAKVGGRGIVNRPRGHAEGSGGEGGVVDMLAKTRPGGAVL